MYKNRQSKQKGRDACHWQNKTSHPTHIIYFTKIAGNVKRNRRDRRETSRAARSPQIGEQAARLRFLRPECSASTANPTSAHHNREQSRLGGLSTPAPSTAVHALPFSLKHNVHYRTLLAALSLFVPNVTQRFAVCRKRQTTPFGVRARRPTTVPIMCVMFGTQCAGIFGFLFGRR